LHRKKKLQPKVTAHLTSIPKLLPEECPLLEQMCICKTAGLKRVTTVGFICTFLLQSTPKAWELPDHHMYIYTITGMGIKISHEIGKMTYIANIYTYTYMYI